MIKPLYDVYKCMIADSLLQKKIVLQYTIIDKIHINF